MYSVLLGIQVAACVVMFLEFIYVFVCWSSRQQSYLMMAILCALLNTAGYTMLMLAGDPEGAMAGNRISYLGKSYVCLVTLFFVASYCRIRIPRWISFLAVAFQTFILILVLSCERHTLFYTSIDFSEEGLFPHLELGHGAFYYLFVVLQAVYFVAAIIMAVRYRRKTVIEKRRAQIGMIVALLLIALMGPIVAMTGLVAGYDLTVLSYCFDTILIVVVLWRYDLLKTVQWFKDYMTDHSSSGIVLADDDDNIVYCNNLASEIISANGFSTENSAVPPILKETYLFYQDVVYQIFVQHLSPFQNQPVHIYLLRDMTVTYHFEEKLQQEVELQTRNAEERRRQVEQISLETVEALASAIDAKDPYTRGHSSRVADYAVLLAKRLGYAGNQLQNLHFSALLHDIGKISIPDAVLNKPGKLTPEEYEVIKSHTTAGADILVKIGSMPDIDVIARYHHERYGGGGYPQGLSGEDIPEIARIVSIADSYDAMNSRRVYRASLTREKIREELVNGRGTQFDPRMLDVFVEMLDRGELDQVAEENNLPDPPQPAGRIADAGEVRSR